MQRPQTCEALTSAAKGMPQTGHQGGVMASWRILLQHGAHTLRSVWRLTGAAQTRHDSGKNRFRSASPAWRSAPTGKSRTLPTRSRRTGTPPRQCAAETRLRGRMEGERTVLPFEQALLQQALTLKTVACPGDRFQTLGLNGVLAVDARPIGLVFDPAERFADQLQYVAIPGALSEHELFRIGLDRHVGNVLDVVLLLATIAFGALNHVGQGELLLEELSAEIIEL